MSVSKPSIPKGTRDFGPAQMIRRNFLFDTIRNTYRKFGFLPLETPAMEQLSVLTGKYGDEGDQLIFKILNSGDFVEFERGKTLQISDLEEGYKKLIPKISEKALRYDLTVPFARYVVMNRNDITFPFKRYQIQPVWRADKPQRGRYREFYQCDADVVGTESLLCEAEIIWMINEVFAALGIQNFVIKLNNRKILSGIAEVIGRKGSETELCVAIDKLDKIGKEKVMTELSERGFSEDQLTLLSPIMELSGSTTSKLEQLKSIFKNCETGLKGVEETETILRFTEKLGLKKHNTELDITLARGLTYYTGAIFEVKALGVQIGSVCGGGRYDNLTGVFGMPGVSGVGISFGVDRIYDVMEELNLFPNNSKINTELLICCFDDEGIEYSLPLIYQFRAAGINSELYPEPAKMKKQLGYANDKAIPYVLLIGSEEIKTGKLTLKNMTNGQQNQLSSEEIILHLRA
jgi:histidyl-tRNA synthetase